MVFVVVVLPLLKVKVRVVVVMRGDTGLCDKFLYRFYPFQDPLFLVFFPDPATQLAQKMLVPVGEGRGGLVGGGIDLPPLGIDFKVQAWKVGHGFEDLGNEGFDLSKVRVVTTRNAFNGGG